MRNPGRSGKVHLLIIAGAALAAACGVGPTGGPPIRGSVELGVAGRSNASLSIDASGRFVAIAWGAATEDGVTDVYTAISRDAGATFGPPSRVNDDGNRANLSGEQPPRVALAPRPGQDPSIVVVWTAKSPAGTRLVSARSDDGGASFAAASALPGSEAMGNRGWQATATDPDGHVVAVWLDHREAVAGGGAAMAHAGAHEHAEREPGQTDGTARAQLSKVFFARLDDAADAQPITGGVCYCCKTTIAAGADGSIYAAWRHVYPGNVRDIALAVSRDGGTTFAPPVRVSEDQWVLDGCPENGPSLAVDQRGRVHIVWPTLVPGPGPDQEPTLALFYAMSPDGTRFTPRRALPTEGVPRHPQIALGTDGAIVVAWDEPANGTRRAALARGRIDDNGRVEFSRHVIEDSQSAVYPVVAPVEGGFVVGWASGSAPRTVVRIGRLQG